MIFLSICQAGPLQALAEPVLKEEAVRLYSWCGGGIKHTDISGMEVLIEHKNWHHKPEQMAGVK